jgi:hypothetical protein
VTALVNAPIGIFIPSREFMPSRIIDARWGEFEQPRSSTFDPVAMVLAMSDRTLPR